MKILTIGDIHGRNNWWKIAKNAIASYDTLYLQAIMWIHFIFEVKKIISDTLDNKLVWERSERFGVYLLKINSASIAITKNTLFTLDVDFYIYNEDNYCVYDSSCKYFLEDSELYNQFFKKVEEDVLSKDKTIDSILEELNK